MCSRLKKMCNLLLRQSFNSRLAPGPPVTPQNGGWHFLIALLCMKKTKPWMASFLTWLILKSKKKWLVREGREHNAYTLFHLGYIWWSRSWNPWSCHIPWSGLPLGQRNRSAWWLGEGRWLEYGIEVTYYNWAMCLEYRINGSVAGWGWLEYRVQSSRQASHGRSGTGLLERIFFFFIFYSAYGRHWIFRRVRLVAPIPYKILSPVTCHLSPVTYAFSHRHRPSPC